jgi:plasmid stabilization system protein ParE
MARVLVRPKARRDINAALVYYIETAGFDVERRFREAMQETFRELAEAPLIGVARKVRKVQFQGVRMWRVGGFESYLIFYIPLKDGIAIERMIHASQDYHRVLD